MKSSKSVNKSKKSQNKENNIPNKCKLKDEDGKERIYSLYGKTEDLGLIKNLRNENDIFKVFLNKNI